MARFDLALTKTLRWEGGETVDTGGYTKWGISQKAFPNLDIKNLTMDQAKAIYKNNYWDPIKGDLIHRQDVANNLFDFAVNSGVSQAVKTMQRVLNFKGDDIDGKLGPMTLNAINKAGTQLANIYSGARIDFYKSLVKSEPEKYGAYLVGWLRRVNDFGVNLATASKGGAVFFFALFAIVGLNKINQNRKRPNYGK